MNGSRFPCLVLLCSGCLVESAQESELTGYMYDNACWDMPDHKGMDGVSAELAPYDHILHCLVMGVCKASGYMLLEGYDDSGTAKYRPQYQFDKAGNEMAIKLFDHDMAEKGDRKYDEKMTVVGIIHDNTAANNKLFREGLPQPPADQRILQVSSITTQKVPRFKATASCVGASDMVCKADDDDHDDDDDHHDTSAASSRLGHSTLWHTVPVLAALSAAAL